MRSNNLSVGTVTVGAAGGSASWAAGPNGWSDYSGSFSYTGPTGVVDLGFEAISTSDNQIGFGNHLDAIQVNLRPFVEFAQPAYNQNEASPTGNRPQILIAGTVPSGGMTVAITITGGTATLGLDYTTASGTTNVSVFVPAGVYDGTPFPLPITMINDGAGDPGETIAFNIASTSGTGAPYNRASLQSCGAPPIADATSTISEDPDPLPRIQLSKALSANRLATSDQFVLRISGVNGQQTTTTGAGSTVSNGTITVGPATVGSAYTLSEVMAGGSPSPLSSYSSSISCTNTTPNSSTVLPSGAGTSFNLSVAATDNISCVFTNDVAVAPAFIDLVKTVTSGQFYDSVGDVATYSYVVTNTGPTSVSALTVTDNRIATVSCPVTVLAAAPGPGNSTTCTGTYTVTQADIDNVLVTNIGTASGQNTSGQVAIDTDDAVINLALPAMTADKATTTTTYATVGQQVPYTYLLRNTGNTSLSAVTVADNRVPVVTCPVTTLAPGESTTCTGDYAITQADIDAGTVTNVMTATATPAAGTLATITDTATITATPAAPALTLDKTVTSGTAYDGIGDIVEYAYLVTNTGNVTISALAITDDKIATVTCPVTILAPQESTTCSGSYTIAQADLDAASVTNNATATGTPARGTLAGATDSATVMSAPVAMRLRKALPLGRFVSGDQFGLSIDGPGGPASTVTTGTGDIATGEASLNPATVNGIYTLSESAEAGADLTHYAATYACTNALAGGQAPTGSGTSFNVTLAPGDDLTCTFMNTRNPIADLSITKTNTPGAGRDDQATDTLTRGATTTYTIVVTNNGPDAVTGAILTDPPAGRSGVTCSTPPTCSGSACPAGLTLAQLEAGVALGSLDNGASVIVTVTCTVD
ncbi:hypothetical protein ABU614_00830 [Lysobacter firmicutimachus]|uniref:DUF11 domain-containing protein n=1 Tax=Lysobacter firmicutimachus TaxID=1792846 RepID=A0AAU8MUU0_9GAMM